MAQYWFDASDSGFAALFTELQITGGKSAPTSSTVNGLPALNWGGNFNRTFFLLNSLPDLSPSATWEVLVRCCINDDDATNNIGPAGLLQGTNGNATGYLADRTYPKTAWLHRYKNNSVSSVASSANVTTVAGTMLEWIWMRLRHEPQGDGTVQLSVKLWKIEEAEPGVYSVTYNDSAANLIGTAGKPGIFVRDSANAYLNAISVGTDGDPAPTSEPAPTNPRLPILLEQGSETLSNLSIEGTVPVALSSTLSQGSQVRVLANFMSTYFLGLWNPGTESDGPLTWPFSYQPFLNQLVLQNKRFVGTTDLAGVPSYTQVDLTEIGTEPYTFYSVSGKINSKAASASEGAQFGLINPVSGAYALVQVWDKNWRLESSNGTDPAEVTSGILAESLNSFTITYNTSVGRVVLFLNESGLSNTIDIPGMSFTQAFWQIENGGESVSFFEELHIGTQPTKYSPQLVYTRPSSSTVEQGSQLSSALQFAGTVPVPLSSTVEQSSAVSAFSNFLQNYFVGFWNPATEPDGPLRSPYEVSGSSNQIVLQSGKLVGTNNIPSTVSLCYVPLDQYRAGVDSSIAAAGKFDLANSTETDAIRLALLDTVSGAQLFIRIGNGQYYLEFFDGSAGFADSGVLSETRGILELSYERGSGNASASLNNSLLTAVLNSPGVVFNRAYFQIGHNSSAFFEEHLVSVWPSSQTQLARYISPNSVVTEQGSEVLGSAQVGTGRRLVSVLEQSSALVADARQALLLSATLEQGSQLLARPGIGLALSGMVEQGSELVSDAGQRLALSSTIEQSSSLSGAVSTSNFLALSVALEQGSLLQARLPVGVPLAAALLQDSALQARFVLGQPFGATALQATAVQTRLRVGQGFVSLLEQGSEAFAGLSLGQRLSATLAQGSDLQSKAVVGNPLAATVSQASSVLGEMRLGAGMAASVYTDSVVSGGLRLGLPLYGMVDQAVTVSGAMTTANPLRLIATLSTPTTLSGALNRDSGVSLIAEIAQQSVLETNLQGGTLAELLGDISTSGQFIVSLKNSVPVASLSEQSSETSVSLKVSIPLGALEIATGSDLGSSLKSQLRLFSDDFQETSIGGATLNTDKRFSALLLQQSEFSVSQDALRFADEAQSQVATEGVVSGNLRMGIRFQATLNASSALDFGRFSILQTLPEFLLQARARISANLRKVGAGSTGYLTVSAIVFHNDYYSEVVFEGIPASEITLLPALRLDTVSIKPE